MLVLSYLFLGGQYNEKFVMRNPGAFHLARWMAKGIYALKIFLYRSQFHLSAGELKAMGEISLFVSLIYSIPWNEAMLPTRAPLNDLLFMRDLKLGIPNQGNIADEALKAFKRHLWYISEELVVLPLFDDRIDTCKKLQW